MTRRAEILVVAVLVNEAGEVQAVVENFGKDTANVRLLTDFTVPAYKTARLNVLTGSRSVKLTGLSLPKPADAQLHEIALEEAFGSRSKRPTGPILAKGFAKLTR